MEKGLVSIITPAYNSEKFIEKTYESIKNQTYKNWEWLVIDDNSIDGTFEILKRLSKEDSRIRIYRNTTNLKAASSRNKGLDSSSGEYITFIDSDDLWNYKFLEKQMKKMKELSQNLVFSSYSRIDEDNLKNYGDYVVPLKVTLNDLLKTNYMSCLTVLYKKEKFKEIKFNENLKMHEDYVMWLEILKKEKEVYTNQEVLATYRIRKKSVSSNKLDNLKYMLYIFLFVEKLGIFRTIYYIIFYIYFGLKKHNYKNKREII